MLGITPWKKLLLAEKAKFAGRTLGAEVVGKMEGGAEVLRAFAYSPSKTAGGPHSKSPGALERDP